MIIMCYAVKSNVLLLYLTYTIHFISFVVNIKLATLRLAECVANCDKHVADAGLL